MEQKPLAACFECGRDVPAANLEVHEATCGRVRSSRNERPSSRPKPPRPNEPLRPKPRGRERKARSQMHPEAEPEAEAEPSRAQEPTLPQLERGQRTLDSWLSQPTLPQLEPGQRTLDSWLSTANNQSDTTQAPQISGATAGADNESTPLIDSAPRTNNSNADNSNSSSNDGSPTEEDNPPATDERPVPSSAWVNVAFNPQFRRGRDGIARVEPFEPTIIDVWQNRIQRSLPLNPLVHGGPFGTVSRVLNGAVNGAVVGFTLFETGGLVVGALVGAAAGIAVDRARNAEDERELRETREVADALALEDGGMAAGTVRVHRGDNGYITALANDSRGRRRVIRAWYGDGREQRRLMRQYGLDIPAAQDSAGDGNNARRAELVQLLHARQDLERSLLEILVQMSYSSDFGPGPGENLVLRPDESFEELTRRFGLGNGNRGASRDVIDSFPVEVVRREEATEDKEDGGSDCDDEDDDEDDSSYETDSENNEDDESESESESEEEESCSESDDEDDEESSLGSTDSDRTSDMGTCGICLEDYKEGELKKTLACPNHPHSFHQECIDKWLKLVATCPICKSNVKLYKEPRNS